MLIRKPEIPSSEITPESLYLNRRQFIGASAAALAGVAVPALAACDTADGAASDAAAAEGAPQRDTPTPLEDVTGYNNFYEYGTDKEDPARSAPRLLRTRPWTVSVEGLC